MLVPAPPKSRRIELILREVDSLPTLPAIAARLLSITTSDESDAREVVKLVSSDPALTAKVLRLCKRADLGVRQDVLTIDRAVVLLGFDAIRNAVLSIKVFELFEQVGQQTDNDNGNGNGQRDIDSQSDFDWTCNVRFDRVSFWRHSLAVAIVAEQIAAAHPGDRDLNPSEAFVCGLLHDIGKLALHYVLPKSFARVIELTDLNQGNIAEFERRILGIDHHTAGKRLAEQWKLPHRLHDCIWLHGSGYESLPRFEHRRMVGLVSLADRIARRQHIGYSGNFTFQQTTARLAESLGFKPQVVQQCTKNLLEELGRRCEALGLDDEPSAELFLQSIQQANQTLGRLNEALARRSRLAQVQARVLDAVSAFHAQITPTDSVQDVLDAVVMSARTALGEGFYAMLFQGRSRGPEPHAWLMCHYNGQGHPTRSQYIEPPPHMPHLSELALDQPASMSLIGLLPWITDFLQDAPDPRTVRLMPLSSGWNTSQSLVGSDHGSPTAQAVLLHDRAALPASAPLSALCRTWAAAIAAASRHDGARRVGEELAEVNRALAEAQQRLLHTESMARLGEMAAGAAHEMNNPLAVISGRSQLLVKHLPPESQQQQAAQTIVEQAHRLSDLITLLRMFADPPNPISRQTDIGRLLDETVRRLRSEPGIHETDKKVSLQIHHRLPQVMLDPDQISAAVTELLHNAVQASPKTSVHVSARIESMDRRLVIQVSDDGHGMDAYTLMHATDPFFSAKAAGRRSGMGLTRAQRLVEVNRGTLELRSTPDSGTVATLLIPLETA